MIETAAITLVGIVMGFIAGVMLTVILYEAHKGKIKRKAIEMLAKFLFGTDVALPGILIYLLPESHSSFSFYISLYVIGETGTFLFFGVIVFIIWFTTEIIKE